MTARNMNLESYCYCSPDWTPWANSPVPRKKENKHRVAIVNGRLRTECDSGRCKVIRRSFLQYVGLGWCDGDARYIPAKLLAYAKECHEIGQERKPWKFEEDQTVKVGGPILNLPRHPSRMSEYIRGERERRLLNTMIENRHSKSEALEIQDLFFRASIWGNTVRSLIQFMNWMEDGKLPRMEVSFSENVTREVYVIPKSMALFGSTMDEFPIVLIELGSSCGIFGANPVFIELCSDGTSYQLTNFCF